MLAEAFLGKEKVPGSNPGVGSIISFEYKSPAFVLQSLRRRSLSFVWGNRCSIVPPNAGAELRNDLVIQNNGFVQQSRGNTGSLVCSGLCSRLPVDSLGS